MRSIDSVNKIDIRTGDRYIHESGVVYSVIDILRFDEDKKRLREEVYLMSPEPMQETVEINGKPFLIQRSTFKTTAESIRKMVVFGRWKKINQQP